MKLIQLKRLSTIFTDLKFAVFLLLIIALGSSLGSIIEQDESIGFYNENYPIDKPIYGFITSQIILSFGIDHIYTTWWFFLLLVLLGTCLISCTIVRQFPLLQISKKYNFRKQKKSFKDLPFFVKTQNIYYLKEQILSKMQKMHFYIYQNQKVIYGYKGLVGRISPILVHFSLLLILGGSFLGAFQNFKAQEVLPKGEVFRIQNPIRVGWFTSFPNFETRVNDFWVEYENEKITQFYSNLSILNSYGNEITQQSISVNNPLRYENVDFYQSDWNLLGVRIKFQNKSNIFEVPLFSFQESPLAKKTGKSWITFIQQGEKKYTLLFDQFQNTFLVYTTKGQFLDFYSVNDNIENNFKIIEILPSTGLLIKYDPSIALIYFGFGLLMITACLSYLPYTQIWVAKYSKNSWIGANTNRGEIQLEIQFENLIRSIEQTIFKNISNFI